MKARDIRCNSKSEQVPFHAFLEPRLRTNNMASKPHQNIDYWSMNALLQFLHPTAIFPCRAVENCAEKHVSWLFALHLTQVVLVHPPVSKSSPVAGLGCRLKHHQLLPPHMPTVDLQRHGNTLLDPSSIVVAPYQNFVKCP